MREIHSTVQGHCKLVYNINMLSYLEITSTCNGCDNCRAICPEKSILKADNEYLIDTWSCTLCNICVEVCPVDAIKATNLSE